MRNNHNEPDFMKMNRWVDFAGGSEIIIATISKEEVPLPEEVTLMMPIQTHSDNVSVAERADMDFPETDGLVSLSPEIAVGVHTADCVPILFYASDIRAVAATHAGWRGTLAGIGRNTVDLISAHGGKKENIHVYISAAICGECYEVSEDLERLFRENGHCKGVTTRHLDLKEINRRDLMEYGIPAENITVCDICTLHSHDDNGTPLLPSWRGTPGTKDRLISAIRLK